MAVLLNLVSPQSFYNGYENTIAALVDKVRQAVLSRWAALGTPGRYTFTLGTALLLVAAMRFFHRAPPTQESPSTILHNFYDVVSPAATSPEQAQIILIASQENDKGLNAQLIRAWARSGCLAAQYEMEAGDGVREIQAERLQLIQEGVKGKKLRQNGWDLFNATTTQMDSIVKILSDCQTDITKRGVTGKVVLIFYGLDVKKLSPSQLNAFPVVVITPKRPQQ
jgi:hypothetical protein